MEKYRTMARLFNGTNPLVIAYSANTRSDNMRMFTRT